MRQGVAILALALFAAAGGTPSDARILSQNSLICQKESSVLQALRDGGADSGDVGAVRKDCSFYRMPVSVQRLSCSGFTCKVRIIDPAVRDGEEDIAYTLRRYQP